MRIALFGAAPDTPNMGVSALFMSTVAGMAWLIDPIEVVVFDNGLGRREENLKMPGSREIRLIRFGARGGRRYHRSENLASMLVASRLGALGARLNEGIHLIDSCAAVLDVSGGDSFSDIYGRSRFDNIYRPKAIAINRRKPLILPPQTYGPYRDPTVRSLATAVVRQSSMAWARDERSFAVLRDLLGEMFDPGTHRCGVDMAFGLPTTPAGHLVPAKLNAWLADKLASAPVIGFNVSGLIWNDPVGVPGKYGFKADYRQAVIGFLAKILAETAARVVLISHVMDRPGHYESDLAACQSVAGQLGTGLADRVVVAPPTLDQSQVKWLIAQLDWFCGTRMHSTIAGLSTGVPTAAISYSDKTLGVFETCAQGRQVMDPRKLTTSEIIDGLQLSFQRRDSIREALAASLPAVKQAATDQLRALVERIQAVSK